MQEYSDNWEQIDNTKKAAKQYESMLSPLLSKRLFGKKWPPQESS